MYAGNFFSEEKSTLEELTILREGRKEWIRLSDIKDNQIDEYCQHISFLKNEITHKDKNILYWMKEKRDVFLKYEETKENMNTTIRICILATLMCSGRKKKLSFYKKSIEEQKDKIENFYHIESDYLEEIASLKRKISYSKKEIEKLEEERKRYLDRNSLLEQRIEYLAENLRLAEERDLYWNNEWGKANEELEKEKKKTLKFEVALRKNFENISEVFDIPLPYSES